MKERKKEGNFSNDLKNILYAGKLVWECDPKMYLYLFVYSLFDAIQPFVWIIAPKLLIDELIGQKRPAMLMSILIGLLLVAVLFSYFIEYCRIRYSTKTQELIYYLQEKLNAKCISMKFSHTEEPDAMDKLATSRTAIYSWGDGVVSIMTEVFTILSLLVAFVGYVGILITLHPLVLLILLLNVLVVCYFKGRAKKKELEILPQIGTLSRHTSYLEDVMHNFEYGKDTRIFHMEEWLTQRTWSIKSKRIALFHDLMKARFLPEGANALMLLVREGVVYTYLIYSFLKKTITIGDFTMYFSTVANFTNWMLRLINSLVNLIGQCRYAAIYRAYIEMQDEEETCEPLPLPEAPFHIRFENVSFKYPHSTKYVYKNLNFEIPAGQKLAIVGINGAGKTTFVKLLSRLYEPSEGTILINDIDIRSFNRKEYWKLFSVVFQEIKTFAFSVAENVAASGVPDRERVQEALEMAGMKEKIDSLEKGIETKVLKFLDPDGIELSGGQNQKLALSRALYKNAPLVVLDEPTAALDALAENEIYERFNQMVGNKTAIYISHRLASTRFCDVIAFFENGCITEYGSHDQLMAQNGSYAEMFKIQAKYYQEDAKNLSSSGSNIMEETDSEFLKEAEQLAVCTTEGGEDIA